MQSQEHSSFPLIRKMSGTIEDTHAKIIVKFLPNIDYSRKLNYELQQVIDNITLKYTFKEEFTLTCYADKKLHVITYLLPTEDRFNSLIKKLNSFRVLRTAALLVDDLNIDLELLIKKLKFCRLKKVGLYAK